MKSYTINESHEIPVVFSEKCPIGDDVGTQARPLQALASADARALEDQLVLRWHGGRNLNENLDKTPSLLSVLFDHRTVTLGLYPMTSRELNRTPHELVFVHDLTPDFQARTSGLSEVIRQNSARY